MWAVIQLSEGSFKSSMSVVKRGVVVFRHLMDQTHHFWKICRGFVNDPLNDPEFDIFDTIPDFAISLYLPRSPCQDCLGVWCPSQSWFAANREFYSMLKDGSVIHHSRHYKSSLKRFLTLILSVCLQFSKVVTTFATTSTTSTTPPTGASAFSVCCYL